MGILWMLLGLGLLMFFAFRGHSILWVAPLCGTFVAVLSGLPALENFTKTYMPGLAGYVTSWFPVFCLGAIYGKVMEMTGSARSLANVLTKLIGSKNAILAVIIPCLLMTYGGISLFVVVFVIYPMGYAIFREANLPRTLLPGCIAYGAFTMTMTSVPGTPQIQNLIPTQFYGTTPLAAPVMGLLATLYIGGFGMWWLMSRVKKARALGLTFEEDPEYKEAKIGSGITLPSWHWLSGLIPLLVVIVVLNVFKQNVIIALLCGILVCAAMNFKQYKILLPAVSDGARGSLIAIMNTSSEVGFGAVVRAMPAFTALAAAVLNIPGGILFGEAIAVNALAGICGSASGGLAAALTALGPQFMERAQAIGMNPDLLHRIASIASGGLDTLPHNGAVLTLLAVSHCTHKQSYKDIGMTCTVIPVSCSLVFALIWGLIPALWH